jgi:K+ transporter
VTLVWFSTLAVLGIIHINDDPSVLAAINPGMRSTSSSRMGRSD